MSEIINLIKEKQQEIKDLNEQIIEEIIITNKEILLKKKENLLNEIIDLNNILNKYNNIKNNT